MRSLQEGRGPIVPVMLAPLVLVLAIGLYFAFEGRGSAAPDEAAAEVACGVETQGSARSGRAGRAERAGSSGGSGVTAARAAFLVDLRKPLDPVHATLPGATLRRAAAEVEPGTELAVYALSPHAEAPRTLLGRLCKTVDLAGLTSDSAKHRTTDDCDLPAQAPAADRAKAREFCRERDALVRRVDALAVDTLGRAAGPAYLLEALEATARDFGETPGALYLFSDLLQHAPWFSHAETPVAQWEYEGMAAAWSALPMEQPLRGFPAETTVRIHYVPRVGTTAEPEGRATHKRFWEAYFDAAAVAFEDHPAMAGYVPDALTEAPTAMELAAYELERLRHSGAVVERERVVVERERVEIERERADIARERAELARDREGVDDARRRLEADQARLTAERRELAALRQRIETRERGAAVATVTGEDGAPLAAGEEAGDLTGDGT